MNIRDVPSPIDLRDPSDAKAWADTAQKRPGREQVFDAFAEQLNQLEITKPRVLELGSGPGFLARHLLATVPDIELTLLDFSEAMHELARPRLAGCANPVEFMVRDFKTNEWSYQLGIYDAVITNQAVHELRHKMHASKLHSQVRELLVEEGIYLVSDHFFGDEGLKHDQLYMTIDEQAESLKAAGYTDVRRILVAGSLALHRAKL